MIAFSLGPDLGYAQLFVLFGSLIFSFLLAGWPGAERIWYKRLFEGRSLTLSESLRLAARFRWRFISLAIGVMIRLILPYFVVSAVVSDSNRGAMIAFSAVSGMLIDVWLTFVTPALAYTIPSSEAAIKAGQRFLKEHWHHAKWFALVPPLAALLTLSTAAPEMNLALVISLSVIGVLLNLLFKGATAAYYLRHNEVPDNGSLDVRTASEGVGR